jgi:hypothetical protein
MHLNTGELVDIAEGTRSEATAPHLAGCEPCRVQLRELRAMMAAAKDVDVPEPSPLFWDHLSARINAAVAQESAEPRRSSRWFTASEGGPRRSWRNALLWRRGVLDPLLAVGALALLIAIVIPARRAIAPSPVAPPVSGVVVADATPAVELLDDGVADDASLRLVASLSDDLDLEGAREAGLAPRGSAEHAVTHMSDGELRELRRLLQEELAHSGA